MNNNAKYARGKIYTIRSHKTDLIYVGSTVEPYLSTRLKGHRNKFKSYKNGSQKYVSSFDIFELDIDCYIELYEDYPCNNRRELDKREGEVIRELNCVNKHIAGRTRKEYYLDNKQQINAWKKHYCENHKQRIKIRKKQWYNNNKEQRLAQLNQKYTCECGGKFTHVNKARHLRTKKHKEYMEFMYN